jgi:hypothetical protein
MEDVRESVFSYWKTLSVFTGMIRNDLGGDFVEFT